MSGSTPVALVTGAARRIGAAIAEHLHDENYRVAIHCRHSQNEARALCKRLNDRRPDSAIVIAGDLLAFTEMDALVKNAINAFGQLDLLVNNASSFFPTPVGATTPAEWNELIGSNLGAPFFLSQAATPYLKASRGSIVNLVDIHARRPLAGHAVYSSAKAGLDMLTRALARELAPDVRVNGVAPGAILWPEAGMSEHDRENVVAKTPLQRTGSPQDIADAVLFLARSQFVTGQVLAVDGGRGL